VEAPHFFQQNSGFLAVIFHIYTSRLHASTDFALFLIVLMQKLRLNGFGPSLRHISYAFGPEDVFGLAVLSGDVDQWYDLLKEDGLVGSYGGVLDIPFITWPIFNDEIEEDIPINIDLARYILPHVSNQCSNSPCHIRVLAQL